MRYICRDNAHPPSDWLRTAEALTRQLHAAKTPQERSEIIEKNAKHWQALKDWLSELSHGKCWYSEARECVGYWHVEHFRPKGEAEDLDGNRFDGYWWLAFDWTNYRLSGARPNITKACKFPIRKDTTRARPKSDVDDEHPHLLDPTKLEDSLLISFGPEGKVRPADQGEWHRERVEVTVKVLALNHKYLTEARKRLWLECEMRVNNAINLFSSIQPEDAASSAKRAQVSDILKELRKSLSEKAEFSMVAVACIQSNAPEWLGKLR